MISEKLSADSRRMLQNGVPQFVGFCRCTPCRQRRGKVSLVDSISCTVSMHPVQAAPRQSKEVKRLAAWDDDAPRAGSAEAKRAFLAALVCADRCTPCRQRRGKGIVADTIHKVIRCTPCRQRRGKVGGFVHADHPVLMHPVQAAPRQRSP